MINEEMYEEEDDELPIQYRRLTAHLQTGSADFNRRLSAYLTNHVAMRSALDQAITSSYAQQYPNAPQFAHNHQSMYPSPFMTHDMPQQQSPQQYVQSPYNMATGTPSYRSVQHFRSASIPGPHDTPAYTQPAATPSPVQAPIQVEQRRMSMPAKSSSPPGAAQTPQIQQSRPKVQQPSPSYTGQNPVSPTYAANPDAKSPGQMQAPPQPPSQPQAQVQPQPQQRPWANLPGYDLGPLTTSLPTETQFMLGGLWGSPDPLTTMFMAGSESFMQPYYNSTPASVSKQQNFHSSYDGMSATLAPSALDISPQNVTSSPPSTSAAFASPPFQLGFDGGLPDYTKGQMFTRSNSSHGSGTGTPVIDGSWETFINDTQWAENAT